MLTEWTIALTLMEPKKTHGLFIDRTGERFHMLTVIGLHEKRYYKSGQGHYFWKCRCDCGREIVVSVANLKRNISCGCAPNPGNFKHGFARVGEVSRTFKCWQGIIDRCENPKQKCFKDYGGRGITMCSRWRCSFEAFMEDMGECPEGLTIDRIETNGNYEPGNCRWADTVTQQNNRRDNRRLTFNGITKTCAQWEGETGIKSGTIRWRLSDGWSIQDALFTPVRSRNLI